MLSKKIREAREKQGYSQKEFAIMLNVSQASVSKYETGETVPRMNKLKEISSKLKYPLSYFLDDMKAPHEENTPLQERRKEIIDVIRDYWEGLGLDGKKEALLDEPLIRFCISRIEAGAYDTPKQLRIIGLLKLVEELSEVKGLAFKD